MEAFESTEVWTSARIEQVLGDAAFESSNFDYAYISNGCTQNWSSSIPIPADFVNFLTPRDRRPRVLIEPFVLVISPFVPHLAEELWQRTGHDYSIHNQSWPEWDEMLAKDEEITLVVQVNGKLRDRVTVPVSITEAEARRRRVLEAAANLKLGSVLIAGNERTAVIQGRLYHVGDVVEGMRVAAIAPSHVMLTYEGETVTLRLHPADRMP